MAQALGVDESSIDISFPNETSSRSLKESKKVSIRIRVIVEQLPEEKKKDVLGIMDPKKFPEDMNDMIMKTPTMANKGIIVTKSEKPILQRIEGIISCRFPELRNISIIPSSY